MSNILILEDDPATRQFLKDVFNKIGGHVVYEAGRVESALKLVPRERFHLMMIDHKLPDGTGYDFLDALVEIPGAIDVPKWLITGERPLNWDAARWDKLGLKGYLVKPFRLENLVEIIQQYLPK